jgi:hypothetical protein
MTFVLSPALEISSLLLGADVPIPTLPFSLLSIRIRSVPAVLAATVSAAGNQTPVFVSPVGTIEGSAAAPAATVVMPEAFRVVTVAAAGVPPPSTPSKVPVNPVAATVELNVAAPAALPSIVRYVVSAVPSVPLKIMSLSFAAASIVMLPELVVSRTAASPAVMSSAAAPLAAASQPASPEASTVRT